MLITDLNFKAILKEFVSLAIGNRKVFHPKPQITPKTSIHPSVSGVCPTVTPVVTAATHTFLPPSTSKYLPSATSSGSNPSQLFLVKLPLVLDVRQQSLKVQGLKLIDLSLVRQ